MWYWQLGFFCFESLLQLRRCIHLHESDLHLYFSWTSALHKLTNPILKLRTRILPFRALQESKWRKKVLRLWFLKRWIISNYSVLGHNNTFIHCLSPAGRNYMGQNITIKVSEVVWNHIRVHSQQVKAPQGFDKVLCLLVYAQKSNNKFICHFQTNECIQYKHTLKQVQKCSPWMNKVWSSTVSKASQKDIFFSLLF